MRRTARAFTFLEVMTVMIIIGIVAAVIAPAMRGPIENTALRSAAREVASAAALARQRAITENDRVSLRFDLEKRTWRIASDADGEDKPRRRRRGSAATSSEDQPRTFPRGVAIGRYIVDGEEQPIGTRREDGIEISFFPDGTTAGGAIELKNRREKRFTVEIAEGTGRIRAYAGKWVSPDEPDAAASARGTAPASRGLQRRGRTESERVDAYKDVASRIFGQVRLQRDLQGEQQKGGSTFDPGRRGDR
jgi:type II secretion system protein H